MTRQFEGFGGGCRSAKTFRLPDYPIANSYWSLKSIITGAERNQLVL